MIYFQCFLFLGNLVFIFEKYRQGAYINELCAILKKNVPRLNLSLKIISNQV